MPPEGKSKENPKNTIHIHKMIIHKRDLLLCFHSIKSQAYNRHTKAVSHVADRPPTLIFLVGEMLEKFFWRSDYIFGLSLIPENQSSKKISILISRFEGQVQTACSHHGPSAKRSVYLIFTSAVASRLVISCTGYCVE